LDLVLRKGAGMTKTPIYNESGEIIAYHCTHTPEEIAQMNRNTKRLSALAKQIGQIQDRRDS